MKEPIQAINGGTMPAITVFSKALKYLGDKITKFIKDTKVVEHPKEITWVITVPAIWQPGARHFMRKAAYAVSFFYYAADSITVEYYKNREKVLDVTIHIKAFMFMLVCMLKHVKQSLYI